MMYGVRIKVRRNLKKGTKVALFIIFQLGGVANDNVIKKYRSYV